MVVAVEENVNIKKISYLMSFALPTGIYRPFQNHPRIAADYPRQTPSRTGRGVAESEESNYHVALLSRTRLAFYIPCRPLLKSAVNMVK